MAWVKKNLFLLIAAVISLAALGYAVFFVQEKKKADEEVSTQLDEAAEKYKQLITRKVHPGNAKDDNIQRAKDEVVKMEKFMGEMRDFLKGPQIATNLNNQMFRAQLDTSIAQLRRQADEAGVTLPNTNFWFTFTQYKTTVDFKNETAGLAAELEDIKEIMRIVYAARVNSLVALKRAPTSDTENYGTGDYVPNRTPRTNDWAVSTAYEVTFQGFSSELARVMEGLANAKQCFVVKSVGVAQAPEERSKTTPAPVMPMQMYNDPYARYRGMGGPYGGGFAPPPVAAAPRPAGKPTQAGAVKTVLDENKLRFTLQVDSIRLKGK
jgi:hypothetical protein